MFSFNNLTFLLCATCSVTHFSPQTEVETETERECERERDRRVETEAETETETETETEFEAATVTERARLLLRSRTVCGNVKTLNKQLADKFKIKKPSTPPLSRQASRQAGLSRQRHRRNDDAATIE